MHHCHDHRTQQFRQQTLSAGRDDRALYQSYPGEAFKIVRFYGFLFSQKRGELLPKVYEALRMEEREKPEQPGFAALIKAFLHTDPYRCILCGNRLRFVSAQAGRDSTELGAEKLHGIDRKRWLQTQAEQDKCASKMSYR
ncbi:putative transposase (plasmid) [Klebsiella oxytoca]|nr:putative transposase [Klebsiella oxytoca]